MAIFRGVPMWGSHLFELKKFSVELDSDKIGVYTLICAGDEERVKKGQECECACTCMRRTARAVTQLYDEAFRPMGYRATQISILNILAQLGPVTLTELADKSVTDRTTLTRNLKLLNKKGLICLEPTDDRREREVCMTKRGREVVKAAHPKWAAVQKKLIAQVGRSRFQRMSEDLAQMVVAVRKRR